ncbi:MAG: hypothetical protein CM15mP112_04430 [Flavobacteriales bacterium]|nr:MAG: hypothetical protein CM15mP112_04430 [Flavobacteriales bacterium]
MNYYSGKIEFGHQVKLGIMPNQVDFNKKTILETIEDH